MYHKSKSYSKICHKNRNKNGFSLIEILISLGIISIGVMGIFSAIDIFEKNIIAIRRNYQKTIIEENIYNLLIEQNIASFSGDLSYDEGIEIIIEKEQITPWKVSNAYPTSLTRFEVALFETKITIILDENKYPLFKKNPRWERNITLLGWKNR